ncbi:hypothetical protein CBS9595_000672 [Malassezia furfur]|nr:hypothetical protein CBS9595_000672 [Malassezia furfur]
MNHLPRGTEYAPGGEYAALPYPMGYQMSPTPGALYTSSPPTMHAVDASGARGARGYADDARAPYMRHIRNSSSPAGIHDRYADPAWSSPTPPSTGTPWSAAAMHSSRRRSHVLQPRTTPVRMSSEGERVMSPTIPSMRPLNATRPFSSSSMHSQSSASSSDHGATDRVLIQATRDNEHFSVVNVSGLNSAPAIKACILHKLQIATQDANQWGLVRTEIGSSDLSNSPLIDDDTLLALCLQLGDDKGTIKFLVQPLAPPPPPQPQQPQPQPSAPSGGQVWAYESPRLRATTSPGAGAPRAVVAPWQMPKPSASVPWGGTYAAPSSVHEAMALGQWPAPSPLRRAPPNATPAWSGGIAQGAPPTYTSAGNRQVAQLQRMAAHASNLQPGMTVQSALGAASPNATPKPAAPPEAPASLQPAHPAYRQPPTSSIPTPATVALPPSPAPASAAEAAPPGYEQAMQTSAPKPRAYSHSSLDARTSAFRALTTPSSAESRAGPVASPSMAHADSGSASVVSDERPSVYPLFKSDERLDAADVRECERSVRPLPIVPSPVSASGSSVRQPDSAAPSSAHGEAAAQRLSWNREQGSSGTTATSVSTPFSDTSEDERQASVQRLMQHMRLAEERKADANMPTFDSFSDDTLGGTFAQSLDASTLRDSDTLRADRSGASTLRDETSRPVLTLSISPTTAQRAAPLVPAPERGRAVERTSSFANRDQLWAFRPPTEQLYEQLDDLFPRHDLDKPLSETATSAQTPPDVAAGQTPLSGGREATTVAPGAVQFAPKASRGLARNQHHSIRVIAQNRKRFLEKTKHVERRRASRDASLLDRRRSTKLWGGRMVEMRTNEPESVGVVPDSTMGPEVEPSARPVFKWVKGDLIGKGTYGRVYLALNATTGEMIAVKQVELPRTSADRDSSRQRGVVAALRSEIETLKDLDHPNVVTCLGFEQTLDTLSIFLEYVPGGSIGSCLRKHGKFDEDTVSSFLNQTLQGLAYLHKQGILHRDLKADNLLVDFQGTCKISDFGTVRRSDDIYSNVEDMSLQGSIFWMAPEVMGLSRKGYSAKVDIWSLGCVVLEMLAGRRPWSDEEAIQAMFKIGAERRAPPIPADCRPSKPAAHFLRNCFEIDPDRRPTAARLLEHVFAWPSPDYSFERSALYQALHKNPVD